jgi:hypothetical protein
VAEGIALGRKHSVGSQEMQDAAEGIGISPDRCGKFCRRVRCLIEHIGNAEIGDDVQTPRQAIPPCDLEQGLKWIEFTHWHTSLDTGDVPFLNDLLAAERRASGAAESRSGA